MVSVAEMAMVNLRMPLLERLELMEHLIAVKRLDVPRLDRRETPHRPREVHEVRFDRVRERMHPDLLGQAIPLAGVAGAARRDDVRPVVGSAARERDEVIARQRLASLELRDVTAAELAAVRIAREKERVRNVPAETARHVDETR